MRREGRLVRVYGTSPNDRLGADVDAQRSLEAWLRSLAFGDDASERQALIENILASGEAAPLPSPMPELVGYSSIIELDLAGLQKKLGTHYE